VNRLRRIAGAIRRNPGTTLLWVVMVLLIVLLPWGIDQFAGHLGFEPSRRVGR
jgi:hypothetical protein